MAGGERKRAVNLWFTALRFWVFHFCPSLLPGQRVKAIRAKGQF